MKHTLNFFTALLRAAGHGEGMYLKANNGWYIKSMSVITLDSGMT